MLKAYLVKKNGGFFMNNPHVKKLDDIEKEYGTNSKLGLSDAQVAEHQAKYGLNQLKGKKQKTIHSKFFHKYRCRISVSFLTSFYRPL